MITTETTVHTTLLSFLSLSLVFKANKDQGTVTSSTVNCRLGACRYRLSCRTCVEPLTIPIHSSETSSDGSPLLAVHPFETSKRAQVLKSPTSLLDAGLSVRFAEVSDG